MNETHKNSDGSRKRPHDPEPSSKEVCGTLIHHSKIDSKRYRKVRNFFIRVLFDLFLWDVVFNRPVLEWLRPAPINRWIAFAREYRNLAIEMGGVLIKLGQFLSTRVDILPIEVTRELRGLQDEVPPVKTEKIIAQIQADFGKPVGEVFKRFYPDPIGAASLAQVHLAEIENGEQVVVKVRRPGIEVLVETDLAAVSHTFRWLKWYKQISSRVDLDLLVDEFATVTRREIDFMAEGANAERIARDFEFEDDVYIPKVYWEYSAAGTLTLENVGYIKIGDAAAIRASGVDPSEVADALYRIYMRQVFETNFVHVDPHPGNIFVKPAPHPDEIEAGVSDFRPGDPVPYLPGRPFQIAFVDFGMTARIPERLRDSLREYAIAIGAHDAYKLVQSLLNAGILLDGTDLIRLEEAHEHMFQRFWGVGVGQLKDVAARESKAFFEEYRDLVYGAPLQFPADLLFIVRAVGILSGLAASLDENFNVWEKTIPFAKRYAKEELKRDHQNIMSDLEMMGFRMAQIPSRIDSLIAQADRGKLTVRAGLSKEAVKEMRTLRKSIDKIALSIVCGTLVLSGTALYINSNDMFPAGLVFAAAALLFFLGFRKS